MKLNSISMDDGISRSLRDIGEGVSRMSGLQQGWGLIDTLGGLRIGKILFVDILLSGSTNIVHVILLKYVVSPRKKSSGL